LISLGCKVCQGCSKGTCPKGIATQDRLFRRRLDPVRGGEHVANYINVMTEEAKMLTQQAGNTDIQKLEKEDLVALTMEASHITGVPLVRQGFR
jgi:glutamate synthase domain-containing protein 2